MIPNWLQRRSEVSHGAKLAYARLAQYAGKDGNCFPKQKTLGAELGVSERTTNEYIRALVKLRLIEMERLGLGRSNRYFFLDHPWMHETDTSPGSERQKSSAPDRKNSSGQNRQQTSAPSSKENQKERESGQKVHTHGLVSEGLPQGLEEALEVAQQLGVDEQFARTEFHSKKAVGWKDGYGNHIESWRDHIQARWLTEQRKRAERSGTGRKSAMGPVGPQRKFNSGDYKQSV